MFNMMKFLTTEITELHGENHGEIKDDALGY
jgi:hypothetical protein